MPRLLVAFVLSSWLLPGADASANARNPSRSASDVAKAVERLPLDKIAGPHRKRILRILEKPVFHRRGPVEAFTCEPKLLQWLIDHPARVGEFWSQLGMRVSPVQALDDGFESREGDHSSVRFHRAFDGPEMRILYCEAETRRPPLPGALRAEMVLVHRYRFSRDTDGRYYVVQQLEGFVTAHGPALKALMKLSRAPCEQIIDRCLEDLMVYFSVLCRVMQMRPEWTLATLKRLRPGFDADEADELERVLRAMKPPERDLIMMPSTEIGSASSVPRTSRPAQRP